MLKIAFTSGNRDNNESTKRYRSGSQGIAGQKITDSVFEDHLGSTQAQVLAFLASKDTPPLSPKLKGLQRKAIAAFDSDRIEDYRKLYDPEYDWSGALGYARKRMGGIRPDHLQALVEERRMTNPNWPSAVVDAFKRSGHKIPGVPEPPTQYDPPPVPTDTHRGPWDALASNQYSDLFDWIIQKILTGGLRQNIA